MQSFTYRLLSLGIRFSCPLVILYLSTQDVLGSYYLFTTFYTLLVFLISLEMAVTFSAKYLQNHSERGRRLLFNDLVMTQAILATVLALPVVAVYGITYSLSPGLTFLLLLFLVVEACVNEVGRFFWNVGLTVEASARDFLRALGFIAAMIAAVKTDSAIVTTTSMTILVTLNATLLYIELKRWGRPRWPAKINFKVDRILRRFRRLQSLSAASRPQILHIQILSLLPLLERSLLEKSVGLAFVGSYSLQYAMVQSGASLVLLPRMAEVRRAVLSARNDAQMCLAHRATCKFLPQVLLYSGACAIAAYFALPAIVIFLGKNLVMEPLTMVIVFLSASATSFASTVSPLYASKERIWVANILTLTCMLPITLHWLYSSISSKPTGYLALLSIGATASLLILTRAIHSRRKIVGAPV